MENSWNFMCWVILAEPVNHKVPFMEIIFTRSVVLLLSDRARTPDPDKKYLLVSH